MHFSFTFSLSAIVLTAGQFAHAQGAAFPTKPIRIIASQPPGGGIDAVARVVSTKLADALGQTVIVDNRPGANGSLAAELIAKAAPDGHTLMVGAIGNLAINAFFYKKLGYDPLKDLAPVTAAITGGQVLVVHPSLPAKSVKELIAIARARPGQLAYASSAPADRVTLRAHCFRT